MVIFRLITQNTIDEAIVQRAQAKRSIEKLIVHQDKFKSGQSNLKETTEKVLSAKEILEILLNKVSKILLIDLRTRVIQPERFSTRLAKTELS